MWSTLCRPSLLSQQSRTSAKMNVVSSEHNVYLHMVQNEDVEIVDICFGYGGLNNRRLREPRIEDYHVVGHDTRSAR